MRRFATALHIHLVLSRAEQKMSTGRRLLLGRGVIASAAARGDSCSARTTGRFHLRRVRC